MQTSQSGEGSPPARPRPASLWRRLPFAAALSSARAHRFQRACMCDGHRSCYRDLLTGSLHRTHARQTGTAGRRTAAASWLESREPTNGHSGAQQTLSRCLWLRSTAADLLGRAGGELWGLLRGTIKTIEGRISNARLPTAPAGEHRNFALLAVAGSMRNDFPRPAAFYASMHRPGAQMKTVNCAGRPVPRIVSSSG